MSKGNSDLLSLIAEPGGTSRIALARATGLSPSKIGKLTRRFLESGLLTEEEHLETARGRRPILLKPARDFGYLIGVDIGLMNSRVVITDLQGKVLGYREMPSEATGEVQKAIDRVFSATDSLLLTTGVSMDKILAVGISHSGGADKESGDCLYWHSAMHWKGVSLKRIFSDRYGVPCEVDDSVRCMTYSERAYGTAKGADSFIFINNGHGIGSGLFLDGEIFTGVSGIAGEVGHIIVVPNGPRCTCGNYGCLEVLASGRSIVKAAEQALQEQVTTLLQEMVQGPTSQITAEVIAQAARAGDRVATRILDTAGLYLGIVVANIINFLNPPLIVLGGGVLDAAGDLLMEVVQREAHRRAFPEGLRKTRIVRSELGPLCAARGAAQMMTEPALRRAWKRLSQTSLPERYGVRPLQDSSVKG